MENIIVIGHGSPKRGANDMDMVGRLLHLALHPGCPKACVKVAYLQYGAPDLTTAILECVSNGARRVIIHPYFLSNGVHVTKDIPEIIRQAQDRHPDREFIYTEPLGIHEKIIQVVSERIYAARGLTPREIEKRSLDIIGEEEDFRTVPAEHLPLVKRVIHATADFEYKNSLVFHREAIQRGKEALLAGRDILTDVEMVKAGINKKLLARLNIQAICRLPAEGGLPEKEKTRTEEGIEMALAPGHNVGVIAIGNAPTALFKAIAILATAPPKDAAPLPLVIGVPVGFVKALEAKSLLMKQDFPYITNSGRKGGAAVAAALVNALLKMVAGENL